MDSGAGSNGGCGGGGGAGSMVKNVFEGRPPLIVSFSTVFEIA